MYTALTIAGSDSSGGAGIQADIKTMTANHVYAMSAITALTAQNTTGVTDIMEVTPKFLAEQLDSIFTDIYPDAIKTGMVASGELIGTIAQKLTEYHAKNIVVDPVMVATSGARLISEDAISTLKSKLLPLATVITPNIPEAEVLSEMEIKTEADMEKAAELQYGKLPQLEKQLEAEEEEVKNRDLSLVHENVSEEEIARIISRWTGIPVAKLTESERNKTLHLDEELNKRVIGQDEGVTKVTEAIIRSKAGIKDPTKPIGSFLFLGPTGVGKTELAKALAASLFDDESNMVRLDMSEYMEKYSVSRLIGAPPGYVGYDEGGQLTEAVRRKPYSVVLFDEVEKAHPDVFNVLLQVLDDGHITDSQGRKVDFSNTVIIMTSNAGAKAIIDPKKLGFAAKEDKVGDYKKMKQGVMEEVKQIFRPEFLNRIDEMIVFHTLDKENMKKIVSLLCNEFTGRLEKQMNIHLKLRNSAKELIVEKGTDTKYGARPLRRALQTELEDKLADAILNGDIRPGDHVEAGASKKEIRFFNLEII